MSKPQPRKYKQVLVAPGSKLYEALDKGDAKLAEKIYQECKKDFEKYYGVSYGYNQRSEQVPESDGNPA